jgi:two-component system nitrate/nitrite response regulator NarL
MRDMQSQGAITILGRLPIAIEGLKRILTEYGFDVIGSGMDIASIPKTTIQEGDFHIVIVDELIDVHGPKYVGEVLETFRDARIVIASNAFDFATMAACFREGAFGYIVKSISSKSLVASLQLVAAGEKVMPTSLVDALPDHPGGAYDSGYTSPSFRDVGLSQREAEILTYLVNGQPNKKISRDLKISEATVKVHVKAILRKVGVQNRTQAAIWAMGEREDSTNTGEGEQSHNGHP